MRRTGPALWHVALEQILLALGVAVFVLLDAAPASAASRHAAMVIDMNTGQTLHAEAADEPRYPASLTKMMTIYMAFEQLEAGRLMPWTKLKVSQEAASAAPTKLDLEPGEQIAVMDAIKALITKSANDMAIVLAEAMGGTEVKFAEMMTQKARSLGMSRTTFRNAHGLPDSGQVTTARDMLTLAMRLQDDFPKLYPLFATKSFTYNGAGHRNHNTLLGTFEGVDGIKTGYTRMSGFNLVTSMRRGEKHLVAVVFGGLTAGTRNVTMRTILTRSLLRASPVKTRKVAPVLVARAKPAIAAAAVAAAGKASPPKTKMAPAQVAATVPVAKPMLTVRPQLAAVEVVDSQPAPAADLPVTETPAVAYEVAKVRPVMVAARVRTFATPVLQSVEASVEPIGEPAAVPVLASHTAPVAQTTIIAKSGVPVRGAPPSSLQAQAQNLTVGMPATFTPIVAPQSRPQQVAMATVAAPTKLRGPVEPIAPLAAAPGKNGFHIQIGAFATPAEAERVLKDAQSKSQGLLAAARPVTAPVQKDSRQLYRARFAGFDAQAAANTCLELRRLTIDCFVMKAD